MATFLILNIIEKQYIDYLEPVNTMFETVLISAVRGYLECQIFRFELFIWLFILSTYLLFKKNKEEVVIKCVGLLLYIGNWLGYIIIGWRLFHDIVNHELYFFKMLK